MNRLQRRLLEAQIGELQSRASAELSGPTQARSQGSLAALAHLSQVGLLVLACLGYVYTIKPVYDKAKLDIEIAKKNEDLARVSASLESLKRDHQAALSQRELAKKEALRAKNVAAASEQKWSQQYAELRAELASRFGSVVFSKCYLNISAGDRASVVFASCALRDALPASSVESLTRQDISLLKRLVEKYGPRIDGIEAAYAQKRQTAKVGENAIATAYQACVDSIKAADEFEIIGSKYDCKKKQIDRNSQVYQAAYSLIVAEEKEVRAEMSQLEDDFLTPTR